ncbi:MAG: alpha/beta fold hydrolase, partial [Candidatus Korarchaeota archaeon]|nr:alpha/beta fold hydrolase [Candidatus Korarchaeota archaeon]
MAGRGAILGILVIVSLALLGAYVLFLKPSPPTQTSTSVTSTTGPITKTTPPKKPVTSRTVPPTKTPSKSTTRTRVPLSEIPHIYHKPDGWNGKCIIFVHGLGGSKEKWLRDMEAFEKEGFCTFAFDLPFHGERGSMKDLEKIPFVIIKGSDEIVAISNFLRDEGAKEVYLISRSLGSIVSGVALGKGASVDKAELLLAAANLEYVHAHGKVGETSWSHDKSVLSKIDPLYFLPKYKGRIHFHCGKKDDLLTPEACQFAYDAATSAAERRIFWHDTGHSMPLEEYFDEALRFFGAGTQKTKEASSALLDLVEIPETCGNGVCDISESWESCPFDCKREVLLVGFQLHIEEVVKRVYYDQDERLFNMYADILDALARKFEEHGAKLSIQPEKNFAWADVKFGRYLLKELKRRGHGIGVQSHLGHHMKEMGLETDEARLEYNREVKEAVAQAIGEEPTNLGAGFDLENVNLLGVCDGCLGFTSMTSVEKPYYRVTHNPPRWLHPWILPPVSMLDLRDDAWQSHDPSGTIVYLPGWYLSQEFEIDCRKNINCFEAATRSLEKALADSDEDHINVWWVSSHLYQSGGTEEETSRVLQAYERWFTEVMDPLAREGKIIWMTFDEMTEIYLKWEKARQRYESRFDAQDTKIDHEFWKRYIDPDDPQFYVYFAVNVNDYYDPDLCAETLNRLLDIYTKYGVRADFYFTGPVLKALVETRPEVIERIKDENMGINYHIRPPHPACDSSISQAYYKGKCRRIQDLFYEEKVDLLEKFESFALITEGYSPDKKDFCSTYREGEVGGYDYVKEVFGVAPVISGLNTRDEDLKRAELEVLRRKGLRMYIASHTGGTNPMNPFEVSYGLLERPSD